MFEINQNDSFQIIVPKEYFDPSLYDLKLFCEKPLNPISNLSTDDLTKKIDRYKNRNERIKSQFESWQKKIETFKKNLNRKKVSKKGDVEKESLSHFSLVNNKDQNETYPNLNSSHDENITRNIQTLTTKGNEQDVAEAGYSKESIDKKTKQQIFRKDKQKKSLSSKSKINEQILSNQIHSQEAVFLETNKQNYSVEILDFNNRTQNHFHEDLRQESLETAEKNVQERNFIQFSLEPQNFRPSTMKQIKSEEKSCHQNPPNENENNEIITIKPHEKWNSQDGKKNILLNQDPIFVSSKDLEGTQHQRLDDENKKKILEATSLNFNQRKVISTLNDLENGQRDKNSSKVDVSYTSDHIAALEDRF